MWLKTVWKPSVEAILVIKTNNFCVCILELQNIPNYPRIFTQTDCSPQILHNFLKVLSYPLFIWTVVPQDEVLSVHLSVTVI